MPETINPDSAEALDYVAKIDGGRRLIMILNIKEEIFNSFIGNKSFKAILKNKIINYFSSTYQFAPSGKPFLIIGSFYTVEISLKNDSAQKFFKANVGDSVKICRI